MKQHRYLEGTEEKYSVSPNGASRWQPRVQRREATERRATLGMKDSLACASSLC